MNNRQLTTLAAMVAIIRRGTENQLFDELACMVEPEILNRFCDVIEDAYQWYIVEGKK